MKKLLKSALQSVCAMALVSLCLFAVARADVRDGRVISARAGGVNFVTGNVTVKRAGAQEWSSLSTEDELKSGDTVRTGADGRVEILLNPGSYFRAGSLTEFTLADANLEDLRIDLARGSAVIEATGSGYGDTDVFIAVTTPRAKVRIVRSGVYRVNVPEAGPTEVAVTKGRALVAETVVKGGKVARTSEGGVEVLKLDKEGLDQFDLWSRERGKELAKANERLTRRVMSDAFARSDFENLFSASRFGAGFWFWNAGSRCYTFLPFYSYWRSPYGFGYDTGIRPYGGVVGQTWPRGYNGPGNNGGTQAGGGWGGGGGGAAGGNGSPAGAGSGSPGGSMRPTPMTPPTRVEPSERPMRERTIEPGSRPSSSQ